MARLRLFVIVASLSWVTQAAAAPNLIANPRFEITAKQGGGPDRWELGGDPRLVTQTLTVEQGREGRRCARLTCAQFREGNAAHAMLCQMGMPVQRGKMYRVALWARARNIQAEMISIALCDTESWRNCGLQAAFVPLAEWQPLEFIFQATCSSTKATRFQIWFTSTGSLWIDDVRLEQIAPPGARPGHVIPAAGQVNLVPNASFECGSDGWGSAKLDNGRPAWFSAPLNRLFGEIDDHEAYDGRHSLRIELTPKNQPVSFFDYYEASHAPVRAPLAANVGYLEVEPGRQYTLSAYMKAREPGTPACLAVHEFFGGEFHKTVQASPTWDRYALSFKPSARWCYVLAGPDLRPTKENPQPQRSATVWVDAVQLQQGASASPFTTHQPLEIGLRTPKAGSVFGWDEPLRFDVSAGNSDGKGQRDMAIELTLTDFFDKEVWRGSLSIQVVGQGCVERQVLIPPADKLRGFLRLHAKMGAGGGDAERTLRLAVIPISERQDSRFGINHAYSWPHLLDSCRQAGLGWVRDWSLKWQEVEPEKGHFTFEETDLQIDRPLQRGLRVLGLLPFPSSDWSSSAPASALARIESDEAYSTHGALTRVAYAPRDEAEFENYVERTVAHYRGRIQWWQVFNESLCTHYSLPPSVGYKPADYARLVKAFARAAKRADPQCRILAGTIGEVRESQTMDDFRRLFAAGALEAIDAVDIHEYPTLRRPEYMENLLAKLNATMDQCGGRKPIWVTECAYWADDDPCLRPMPRVEDVDPLPNERMQAEFTVCWAAVLFAGGVDKIFYHAGTCCGINSDNPWDGFFKFDGQPKKIYAAQAVLSHLLGPTCRFVRRLAIGEGARCYLFRDGSRLVAVVWRRPDTQERTIHLASEKMSCCDLMGRSMEGRRRLALDATPFYILADGLSDEAFATALK